jgi:hypothetical protein
MNRFDNFFYSLLKTINEAEGDSLPVPPGAGPAGPAAGGPAPMSQGMPGPGANNQEMPPIAPEDNISDNEDEESALISGKKLQLIKLIAVAISTRPPSTDTQDSHKKQTEIHKILTLLSKPATDGTVEKMEKQIISSIAKLQDVSPYEIAKTIDYTTPGPEEESNRYIDITEYKNLIEIARKALIANPDEVAGVDKLNIEPGKINGGNAQEVLSKIQNIYGRVL